MKGHSVFLQATVEQGRDSLVTIRRFRQKAQLEVPGWDRITPKGAEYRACINRTKKLDARKLGKRRFSQKTSGSLA